MGYWAYYLLLFGLSYLLRYPWLLALAAGVWLARRWLPDPYLFFRHLGHVRRLRADIAANPDNVTARRDLAKIWLTKKRPRRAIPLLDEARQRDTESAELALLAGTARLEAGRAEEALPLLVEAATKNERQQYGQAFLVAGRALAKLGRWAEAEDAFVRYLAVNSSTVEGRVRLAAVRRELKDVSGAKTAMREAVETFAVVPGYRRRAELGWYLRARLMMVGLA
jgi:thioredoxin-like negative regulator of GroEL